MEVFKEGAAEFFGLDVKIIASAETEIKNIDIKSQITLESIDLARNIHNNKEKNNCLMLLYALFDKFGDDAFAIAIFRENQQFSYLIDNCKVHINMLIASINRKRGIGHE